MELEESPEFAAPKRPGIASLPPGGAFGLANLAGASLTCREGAEGGGGDAVRSESGDVRVCQIVDLLGDVVALVVQDTRERAEMPPRSGNSLPLLSWSNPSIESRL